MLNKYSFIDKNRIAASGVSYGGYAVGMMLAKSGEESNSMIRCGKSTFYALFSYFSATRLLREPH